MDRIYFLKKWFRVDIKPFKTAFLNAIKRWSMTFKKHLLERVVNNLADLNSFIERADEGLMQQVKEGDYENLINVMGILRVKSLLLIINIIFNPKKICHNRTFIMMSHVYHFRASRKGNRKRMLCLSLWEQY